MPTVLREEGFEVRPFVGITLRQYNARRKTWVVEFLNVFDFFLWKQVNGAPGTVYVEGRTVTVASGGPTRSREHYVVVDQNNFVYRLDLSTDGGRRWDEGRSRYVSSVEVTRVPFIGDI